MATRATLQDFPVTLLRGVSLTWHQVACRGHSHALHSGPIADIAGGKRAPHISNYFVYFTTQ